MSIIRLNGTRAAALIMIVLGIVFCGVCVQGTEVKKHAVLLETDTFAIGLDARGQTVSFIEKQTGKNILAPTSDKRFCVLFPEKNRSVWPTSVRQTENQQLEFIFTGNEKVVLKYIPHTNWIEFEVVSVESPNGKPFYRLNFGTVAVAIKYDDEYIERNPFALSNLILNINTSVVELPGLNNAAGGICFSELGYKGARYAMLGMPASELRAAMKQILLDLLAQAKKNEQLRESLPVINLAGGPFAMDIPKCNGVYVTAYNPLVTEEFDVWSEHLERFGIDQIDVHQGHPFTQADFRFNPKVYPNGASDFRVVSDRFKEHGILLGLHTYSAFLPWRTPYPGVEDSWSRSHHISPVPSDELADVRQYTLSENISESATELGVKESTDDVQLRCSYLIWNSHFLRVDNELIEFNDVRRQDGRGFIKCVRGALGTTPAKHSQGTPVHHLGSFFDHYFAPKPGSELFFHVAQKTAQAYDEGGFGMIYLDALDGMSRQVANHDYSWYYTALFVREILRNIKTTPPLMEYSMMEPSIWAGRSRGGAADTCNRGYQRFIDNHFKQNAYTVTRRLLPSQMGWFDPRPAGGPGKDLNIRTLHREWIEYIASKSLAKNYALSFRNIPLGKTKPGAFISGEIFKRYDKLRRQNYFSKDVTDAIRPLGEHFTLIDKKPGVPMTDKIEPGRFTCAKASYPTLCLDADRKTLTLDNPYSEQVPEIRIENRYSAAEYNDPNAVELIAFDEHKTPGNLTTKNFDPGLNLLRNLAVGLWVFGDGGGQMLNIRLSNPSWRWSTYNDHIVKLDHKGWKYIQLAETDTGLYPELQWPIAEPWYQTVSLRAVLYYLEITSVHVMVIGDTKNLRFRTLKALPIVETKLTNPTIESGGKRVIFQGAIPSGEYMEYQVGGRAIIRDPSGNETGEMKVVGTMPVLKAGKNELTLSGTCPSTPRGSSHWVWKLIGPTVGKK
ncbi:MAG: hypothetical protein Q4G59_01560 [Planctomycetia bacterium]|nr:hypothetical protein [Planctomycetia bacterium]